MVQWTNGITSFYQGDCREVLAELPAESVQCVVTSPPYWGLRDYGTGTWEGGNEDCDHKGPAHKTQAGFNERWYGKPSIVDKQGSLHEPYKDICLSCGAKRIDNQLGLEPTPDAYVANMVEVFRAVRRVLRKDGTVWLNLGDSYAGSTTLGRNDVDRKYPGSLGKGLESSPGSRQMPNGLKPKDLVGIPWRVAFALQADGWYLRADIIWSKPNPMPESVTDRPTKAHEYIFLLTKSPHYYYDADAIREPQSEGTFSRYKTGEKIPTYNKSGGSSRKNESFTTATPLAILPSGRNKRSVWEVDTKYQDATYGGGGTSFKGHSGHYKADGSLIDNPLGRNKRDVWEITTQAYPDAHFATFPEALVKPCILAGTKEQDTVLDPFAGSGTVMQVAQGFGRNSIGVELSDEYIGLAIKRLERIPLPMIGI